MSVQSVFRAARPAHTHNATSFLRLCRHSSHSMRPRATAAAAAAAAACTADHHQPLHHNLWSSVQQQKQQKRTLATTPHRHATVVAQNPRQDEDGKDMTITISDRAAKRLKQITSSPPPRNTLSTTTSSSNDSHLRVTVTSGGCHGFQYLMSLEPASRIDPDEDTVFVDADGNLPEGGGGKAKVVLDESSLELLKGSTVDFTTELIGSQFKIVGNPRATSSCGCGTSFDIE